MRVYVAPPAHLSRAMFRVAEALAQYRPSNVEIVDDAADAELVVLHAIGYGETELEAHKLTTAGKRYAVMQYCLRSTQKPNVEPWLPIWRGAAAVWSYYDLAQLAHDDGFELGPVPFYYAPLGADSSVFSPALEAGTEGRFAILTSGYVAQTEGVLEAAAAARAAGRRMYHLGPDLQLGPHVARGNDITDEMLAGIYRRCDFVAGLRRIEGFEMPAAEGLLCGARPVCFDRPHYRRWFGPWARFVPEHDADVVTAALLEQFELGPGTLTEGDLMAARSAFEWRTLVAGFWRIVVTTAR
jgi:hypothetical protein